MRLLLTSNGLSNKSIVDAFIGLVDKPSDQIKVAFIPTAGIIEDDDKDWLITDLYRIRKAVGYVDIVDIAQLTETEWKERIDPCDVIFVGGGNTRYLSYWMQESGLRDALPKLLETKVYAGISAGSIFAGDNLDTNSSALKVMEGISVYDEEDIPGRSLGEAAQLVPFAFRPHLNSPGFPMARTDVLERASKNMDCDIYALDDESAIRWADGELNVISEGEWILIPRS